MTRPLFGIQLLDGSAVVGVFHTREAAEDTLRVVMAGRGTVIAHPWPPRSFA